MRHTHRTRTGRAGLIAEGRSSDDEAEDTWLPVLTTLQSLLDVPVHNPPSARKTGGLPERGPLG
jgi:hypothetical protein